MHVFRLLVLVSLTGCGIATRHFYGIEPVRVTVDGSNFDIRVRGRLAEAIRVNPQYAPRLGPLRARAGFAMAKVSGCKVSGVLGDQAVMTSILDCSDAVQPSVHPDYDCIDVARWLQSRRTARTPDYVCSP